MTSKQKVAVFNSNNKIGTAVCYWPMKKEGDTLWHKDGKRTHTRTEAYLADSGHPVVFLEGIRGYVMLDHVEVGSLMETASPCFDKNFAHKWA